MYNIYTSKYKWPIQVTPLQHGRPRLMYCVEHLIRRNPPIRLINIRQRSIGSLFAVVSRIGGRGDRINRSAETSSKSSVSRPFVRDSFRRETPSTCRRFNSLRQFPSRTRVTRFWKLPPSLSFTSPPSRLGVLIVNEDVIETDASEQFQLPTRGYTCRCDFAWKFRKWSTILWTA